MTVATQVKGWLKGERLIMMQTVVLTVMLSWMAFAQAAVVENGADPALVQDGFQFTEGPATDVDGSVLFTDVRASRIYRWTPDGRVELFRENTGGANGLFFAPDGDLIICEGDRGRITALDRDGELTVLADSYNGTRFNRPNDVWVALDGGVYFSDPLYGQGEPPQDGEHVYYISPDRSQVVRVIDDMVKPNGLIGTRSGRTLYVTDAGAGKTRYYHVEADGSLSNSREFCQYGGDGMTIDSRGNVYLAEDGILVFNREGELIGQIEVPERPTNLTFCGPDRRTLFITARSSVYTVDMTVRGITRPGDLMCLPRGSFMMGDHHNLGGLEH